MINNNAYLMKDKELRRFADKQYKKNISLSKTLEKCLHRQDAFLCTLQDLDIDVKEFLKLYQKRISTLYPYKITSKELNEFFNNKKVAK